MSRFIVLFASAIVSVAWFVSASAASSRTLAFEPAPGSSIAVGPMPGRPAVGDVNGDTHPDNVVTCGVAGDDQDPPTVGHCVILLGNGKGEFAPAAASPLKIRPSVAKVALGDVNGDGKLDAVYAGHDTYEVNVMLGDGAGGFANAPDSPFKTATGSRAHTHEIVLADTDGEGSLDVLTTNVFDDSVSVLLGDGRPRFVPSIASPVNVGDMPYDAIALPDLDGDNDVDLLVGVARGMPLVLLGNGDGTFQDAELDLSAGLYPAYAVLADFDHDGRLDIVTGNNGSGDVTVLLARPR